MKSQSEAHLIKFRDFFAILLEICIPEMLEKINSNICVCMYIQYLSLTFVGLEEEYK